MPDAVIVSTARTPISIARLPSGRSGRCIHHSPALPHPLAGEGWGGGAFACRYRKVAPSLTLPRKR